MTDEFTVTMDSAPLSKDGVELSCEICGVELIYAGRGRKPSRCKDHKKGSSGGSTPRQPRGSLKNVQENLTDAYVMIGIAVAFYDPFAGLVIGEKADHLAASWVKLAETNPKIRKALERMTEASGWASVVGAHVAIAVPIMRNRGIIPTFGPTEAPQSDQVS
jgi:hypothetical protein